MHRAHESRGLFFGERDWAHYMDAEVAKARRQFQLFGSYGYFDAALGEIACSEVFDGVEGRARAQGRQ